MAFEYEPEKDKEEPRRHGDLVVDFDCKEDPEQARKDCVRFVNHLFGHIGAAWRAAVLDNRLQGVPYNGPVLFV